MKKEIKTTGKYCERCGEEVHITENITKLGFGFRPIELYLCTICCKKVRERNSKIKDKFTKKLVKLSDEYQRRLLR